eukprot:CAMPEP_0197872370 /NCGR_PEP_ID=MMETSP1439-20131203/2488_1 /TAXON_ID=66791 /ORGANISM="Gonyaulax spinifera, Strain CCMP409" /LENGTH=469 /DNA_ID=CAMNT_0043491361 /DNA_START=64 /DNA_END=1473 /DNA_ORIENTATION=-
MSRLAVVALACSSAAVAQQAGSQHAEGGPAMTLQTCTKGAGCSEEAALVTLDANWRWAHSAGGYANCYKDSQWDKTLCPDGKTCAANCALETVSSQGYANSYGIKPTPGGIELQFVTRTQYGSNFGSRVYMLEQGGSSYRMFKLKNREFALDVDVSQLPCGLNGAVYFVEMDKLGGKGGGNKAGAKYGTGYCDAQCPHDVKFIGGEANVKNWNGTANPPIGHYGVCCAEMDIWEANSRSTAYTPHPCSIEGPQRCEGTTCGDNERGERYAGVCDKDGCDFNSYRMGQRGFYGLGSSFDVDTSKPVKVVTQFLTADGTDSGDLVEIRRFYTQEGKIIPNSNATILGPGAGNSITDSFCSSQKSAFGDIDDFKKKGSLKKMGEALDRGMVLVLSLWDDSQVNMLWLDAAYPTDQSATKPGVARGPCPGGFSSTPSFLRTAYPQASVKFTDVSVGEIGSTLAVRRRLASTFV